VERVLARALGRHRGHGLLHRGSGDTQRFGPLISQLTRGASPPSPADHPRPAV
jgi:hypothetical protein